MKAEKASHKIRVHGCIYELPGPRRAGRVAKRVARGEDAARGVAELLPVVFPRDKFITLSSPESCSGTNEKSPRRGIQYWFFVHGSISARDAYPGCRAGPFN